MIRKKYTTKRLVLRALAMRDFKTWQDYYTLWGEKSQSKYVKAYTKEECSKIFFEEIVTRHRRLAKEDKVYVWGAFCKKTKELIAVLDIGIIHRDEYQMANLGYRVGHRYWRQGFATEIIKCGCKKIAKDLKLQRLQAAINLDNRASMKTSRAAGLYREGIKRRYLLEKGAWTDNVVYVYLVNCFKRGFMKFILVFIFVIFSLPTFAEVGSCSGSWVEFPESVICQDLSTDNHDYIEALKRGCSAPAIWSDELCSSDIIGRCKFVAANAIVNVTYKNIPDDILEEEKAGCATDGGVWEDTYFRK